MYLKYEDINGHLYQVDSDVVKQEPVFILLQEAVLVFLLTIILRFHRVINHKYADPGDEFHAEACKVDNDVPPGLKV